MAIQVNGTQVIGNSRELTNITSVDATTVATLNSAGVGGEPGWEYVTTITNSSTVSYIDYDFDTTYNHFMIMGSGWRSSSANTNNNQHYIRIRFKTSSSTLYSGYMSWENNNSETGWGDFYSNLVQMAYNGATYTNSPSTIVYVKDVKDSSTKTRWSHESGGLYQYDSNQYSLTPSNRQGRFGEVITPGAITGIRFYPYYDSIISGTKLKIWGML